MKRLETIKTAATVTTGTAIGLGGQSAALGVATAVGTASTGTAISSLTGVAASNAATAWLGGGALAAGGGGMAVGSAVLSAIPVVGWGCAAIGVGYGIYKLLKHKK